MTEPCPKCNRPWAEHDFGAPAPDCPATPKIRLFQLDECDTWAGESLEQVLAAAREQFGAESYEDAAVEAFEVPEGTWDIRTVCVDEDRKLPPITFREALAGMVAAGDTFPALFCSTEY